MPHPGPVQDGGCVGQERIVCQGRRNWLFICGAFGHGCKHLDKRNRRRCGVPRINSTPQMHGRKGYLAEGQAGHKTHRCGSVPTKVEKWADTGTHCGPSTLLGTLLLFGRRWVSSPGPSHLLIIVFWHLLVQLHGIGHVVAPH